LASMNLVCRYSLLLLALLPLQPVQAAANQALADVQHKIQDVGGDVKRLLADKQAQIEQLRRVEKQYGEQARVVYALKTDIQRHERQLQEIRSKIFSTQKDLQLQKSALQSLLKSAYVIGDRQDLGVLFNQRDPALSGRMMVYYDYIGKARLYKLEGIENDVLELRRLETDKDGETQQLQDDLASNQQEMQTLQHYKQQREQVLASIDKDYRLKQDQLSQLLHDEQKLEHVIAELPRSEEQRPAPQAPAVRNEDDEKPTEDDAPQSVTPLRRSPMAELAQNARPFADLQGQLPWPVKGALSARFGSKRFETTWDGAVISANEGADVHAIAPGRVVFSDWLRGYGLMTIVDHGKGFMSLYAFNQSLYKQVGDSVAVGDTLAAVGRSGGRNSSALYFGIRKNGKPVDPERWCRKPG
jgi:murein hydrolase activator